jgi:hypothetical protein
MTQVFLIVFIVQDARAQRDAPVDPGGRQVGFTAVGDAPRNVLVQGAQRR